MESPTLKGNLPPYMSAVTLWNNVELLRPMPPRIDKSVFASASGLVKGQLMSAFRFLRFIDDKGVPHELLREIATASKEDRGPLVLRALQGAYPFLNDESFDLSATSTQSLEEEFKKLGVTGSTIRKCISFFQSLAKDAGLDVSPHVKSTRAGGNGIKKRAPRKAKDQTPPFIPPQAAKRDESDFWRDALGKLPTFDPALGPTGVENYAKIMSLILEAKSKEDDRVSAHDLLNPPR